MKTFAKKLPVYFLTCLLFCAALLAPMGSGKASAATNSEDKAQPISALQDLFNDNNFNPLAYPSDEKNYSIQIIQIAESTNNGLIIYTYQPSQNTINLTATEINMALSKTTDNTRLYKLTLLNTEDVFCKYKVNDFSIKNGQTRYYNITSIYRKWEKDIDMPAVGDDTKSAVAFPVGKLYTVTEKDDELVYTCEKRNVIEILNPYTGFIRYTDGFLWHKTACDSHYIAFSTDIKIDELYEAEIEYKTQTYEEFIYTDTNFGPIEFGPEENNHIILTDDDEFEKDGKWWLLGESAEYNRIQTVNEFIKNENLTDNAKKYLETQKWVLRFCETDYAYQYYPYPKPAGYHEKGTHVYDVTILRLYFKSDDTVYNLGAVSDKITESRTPSNERTNIPWYIWLIDAVLGVLLVVVLVLFFPILRPIVAAILKVLWWIITAPFRFIAWAIKKIFKAVKKRKAEKAGKPPEASKARKKNTTKKTGTKANKK